MQELVLKLKWKGNEENIAINLEDSPSLEPLLTTWGKPKLIYPHRWYGLGESRVPGPLMSNRLVKCHDLATTMNTYPWVSNRFFETKMAAFVKVEGWRRQSGCQQADRVADHNSCGCGQPLLVPCIRNTGHTRSAWLAIPGRKIYDSTTLLTWWLHDRASASSQLQHCIQKFNGTHRKKIKNTICYIFYFTFLPQMIAATVCI